MAAAVGESSELIVMRRYWEPIRQLPARLVIAAIRLYQLVLSPLLGKQCRFHPSCSQYAIEALRKYGFFKGTWKAVWRVARCNPFHPGGDDPP
jgi:uncharacterized protein